MEPATTIVHRSLPLGHHLHPLRVPQLIWRHRGLIRELAARAVASRYRGSALGFVWSLILPLAMLSVYTFVFAVVFRARWTPDAATESRTYFALTLFCGMVLYSLFAECVAVAPTLVLNHASYVKRVVFPLEILPIVTLAASLVNASISLGVLLAGMLLFLGNIPPTTVFLLLVALPLLMLCLGVSWFLASVGVYVRDTANLIGVVLQMLIFMTPVFYPASAVPPAFQSLMRLNPLTAIVENGRRVLMLGQPPDWISLVTVTAVAALLMQLGYAWFMKTKRGFADVL